MNRFIERVIIPTTFVFVKLLYKRSRTSDIVFVDDDCLRIADIFHRSLDKTRMFELNLEWKRE